MVGIGDNNFRNNIELLKVRNSKDKKSYESTHCQHQPYYSYSRRRRYYLRRDRGRITA